jgi:hypothetical protein
MLKKPRGLSAAMTAGMVPGEQREDGPCAGQRVRWQAFVKRVFFEQYRTRACGTSGWVKLGRRRSRRRVTLLLRMRAERGEGSEPQLEKRNAHSLEVTG